MRIEKVAIMEQNRVYFFDTTLRDGEQTPGVSLQTPEKIEIAKGLVRLGIDVIEAGFPAASPGDFEAVQTIAREVKGATICALVKAMSARTKSDPHSDPLTGAELGAGKTKP